jgi:hypothetical protein
MSASGSTAGNHVDFVIWRNYSVIRKTYQMCQRLSFRDNTSKKKYFINVMISVKTVLIAFDLAHL